jgi:hypothetical protein
VKALDGAIRSTLTGGTALTSLLSGTASVYHLVAGRSEMYPCIVWQSQGGGDENDHPARTKNLLYTVKAVSHVSATQAAGIDAQIDALLHGATLTVPGWANFWTMREMDIEYAEPDGAGGYYFHAGGVYRVRLAAS